MNRHRTRVIWGVWGIALVASAFGSTKAWGQGIQACCRGNGSCVEDSQYNCMVVHGTANWQGVGTHCLGVGACCHPDGTCFDADEICCDDLGGVSRGFGTTCADANATCEVQSCCTAVPTVGNNFCDNCSYADCVSAGATPLGPGPFCSALPNDDNDLIPNPCDNCTTADNPSQVNSDADTYGDECDNCPSDDNEDQVNSDTDDHGNACDNCLTTNNNSQVNSDGDLLGDACDNCPFAYNPGQQDCDNDGEGDACEDDCDGDAIPDDCDPDIDNDGVANADDVCDYTPILTAVITQVGHRLRGTIYGDVDGDCDRDNVDLAALFQTAPSCTNGQDKFERFCAACNSCCSPCPACNSCCGGKFSQN